MIAYLSRTGNVEHIVNRIGYESVKIEPGLTMRVPYLLFVYTTGLGDAPEEVFPFLDENASLCIGVVASGNSNFGHNVFCGSADKIHKKYGIPIVRRYELRGFQKDDQAVIDYCTKYMEGQKYEQLFTPQQ